MNFANFNSFSVFLAASEITPVVQISALQRGVALLHFVFRNAGTVCVKNFRTYASSSDLVAPSAWHWNFRCHGSGQRGREVIAGAVYFLREFVAIQNQPKLRGIR